MERYYAHIKSTALIRGNLSAEHFEYSVNVSMLHNFMYVETPKAGCSSIKASLQKYEWNRPDFEWRSFDEVHIRPLSPLLAPRTILDFENRINTGCWYQFGFVRDPFARLLSSYLDKICTPSTQRNTLLMGVYGAEVDLTAEFSFASFVQAVCDQESTEMDAHWRPQHELLCHGNIRYDKIGRMEMFYQDFAKILDEIGAGEAYLTDYKPHATGARAKLSRYYTPELISLVVDKYAEDFEVYGYETTLV